MLPTTVHLIAHLFDGEEILLLEKQQDGYDLPSELVTTASEYRTAEALALSAGQGFPGRVLARLHSRGRAHAFYLVHYSQLGSLGERFAFRPRRELETGASHFASLYLTFVAGGPIPYSIAYAL